MISPNETHTYTTTVTFNDKDYPQDENKDKSLAAHIEVFNAATLSTNS